MNFIQNKGRAHKEPSLCLKEWMDGNGTYYILYYVWFRKEYTSFLKI